MLNQEQLAAIAAAMSLVQQTLQQSQQPSASVNERPQPPPSDVVKASQPISYSAVVAKSTGLNISGIANGTPNHSTNSVTINTNTPTTTTSTNGTAPTSIANSIKDAFSCSNCGSNTLANQVKLPGLPIDCNPYGGLLSQTLSGLTYGASSNHLLGINGSDTMNVFASLNGTNNINGHSLHNEDLSLTTPIANYTLNHIANRNANGDVFTTQVAGGFGHTNGSSLLTNHNSNSTMAHESNLDKFAVNNPIIPAHQLFSQLDHSFRQNHLPNNILQLQQSQKPHLNNAESNSIPLISKQPRNKNNPAHGRATNLLGFMGLYVGNLSPDLSKEQLEKIFSKYGEPVKAHRLIRSPVAFIKYENTESPRAAIDDLFGIVIPELTLNQDQPLKLHFDRNDAQLRANYRPTELPKDDNGECYGWRTTICRRGKNCTKKHIPINRGIDFQMWMIKTEQNSRETS